MSSNRGNVDRVARELIDTMKSTSKRSAFGLSEEVLEQVAIDATNFKKEALKMCNKGLEESKVAELIDDIYNNREYQAKPESYVRSHLDQVVPVLVYAWNVANRGQFPKDTQIVALLLFVHSREQGGLLEQVKTGEGKTLIVGLTGAFMALCGCAVDIVSSNRDLAIEGAKKCASFYELLRLNSGHICTEDDAIKQDVYELKADSCQGNVVYGEVGSFQRDILEQEYNNKSMYGSRYENRPKCLIVDEVDSMCLDKARNVLYLSHEMDCLKWLESLFMIIWACVLRVNLSDLADNNVAEQVKDVSEYVTKSMASNGIQVPVYLDKYIRYKVSRWVESAFQARMMQENDHFILGKYFRCLVWF